MKNLLPRLDISEKKENQSNNKEVTCNFFLETPRQPDKEDISERMKSLVTESGELLVDGSSLGSRLEGGGLSLLRGDLALVESGSLDLSLLLETVDNITVRPSDLVGETLGNVKRTKSAYFREFRGILGKSLTFKVQNLRPGLRRRTRRAEGTTIFFLRS